MDENQKIEAYIQQIMRIKASKDEARLQDDYRSIARELGFEEADLAAIEEERLKMIQMGKGFLMHQQPQDAIAILEKAYIIENQDEATLQYLAEAYGMLYVKSNKIEFKKRSEEFASACLQVNPQNQSAFRIIQSVRYQPVRKARWGNIVGFGLVLGFLALLAFWWMPSGNSGGKPDNTEPEAALQQSSESGSLVQANDAEAWNVLQAGQESFVFETNSANIKIFYEGRSQSLAAKNKGDKRKYYDQSGKQVLEVRMYPGESRFKIKDAQGNEKWKVKWTESKIKIEAAQGNALFELKRSESGKVKILSAANEIGSVGLPNADKLLDIEAQGSQVLQVKAENPLFAHAVLGIAEIPLAERLTIAAELAFRKF
jgi:uncharacterized protein YkuJ